METNNIIKINNEIIAACVLILVGCTVLGLGIGIMVSEIWACTIIGVGLGFLIDAGLILKIYYQKREVSKK